MEKILVLASSSPQRAELLKKYVSRLVIIKPKIVEKIYDDPYKTVLMNSREKALSVLHEAPPRAVIIGTDTIIYSKQYGIIGKPQSMNEAAEILLKLRGKWHSVITGVTIIDIETLATSSFTAETSVKLRDFTKQELREYLATMEPMGKAGAYAVQGIGALLVEIIVGDFYNVVGLPLARLYVELRKYGINLLKESLKKKVVG